jgi:hypothetical protein
MKRDDDPERLLSSSSSEDAALRALLAAGRDELPREAQLAALATKLGPILGPGGGGGGGGGGAGPGHAGAAIKAAGGATLAKAIAAVVAGAVVSVAVWRLGRSAPVDTSPIAAAPSIQASTPPMAMSAETAAPAAIAPSATMAATAPRASVAPRPTSSSPSPDDPDREVKLLQRAQDALAVDQTEALAICAEHARTFPHGLLAQEREVIAVDALVRLGRMDEARERGERFAATFPSSTHRQRIETLLGQKH